MEKASTSVQVGAFSVIVIVKTDCETDGSYAAGGGDHSLLVTAAADAFLQPRSLPGPLVTASCATLYVSLFCDLLEVSCVQQLPCHRSQPTLPS